VSSIPPAARALSSLPRAEVSAAHGPCEWAAVGGVESEVVKPGYSSSCIQPSLAPNLILGRIRPQPYAIHSLIQREPLTCTLRTEKIRSVPQHRPRPLPRCEGSTNESATVSAGTHAGSCPSVLCKRFSRSWGRAQHDRDAQVNASLPSPPRLIHMSRFDRPRRTIRARRIGEKL